MSNLRPSHTLPASYFHKKLNETMTKHMCDEVNIPMIASDGSLNRATATIQNDNLTPPSIALIGCGPSGMFFLHSIALRRKKLEQEGNAAAIAALPVVTCFERASAPGGIWRADRRIEIKTDASHTNNYEDSCRTIIAAKEEPAVYTNMYEALWTNGPKEAMEFFDYTFDDHFGCTLPVY